MQQFKEIYENVQWLYKVLSRTYNIFMLQYTYLFMAPYNLLCMFQALQFTVSEFNYRSRWFQGSLEQQLVEVAEACCLY